MTSSSCLSLILTLLLPRRLLVDVEASVGLTLHFFPLVLPSSFFKADSSDSTCPPLPFLLLVALAMSVSTISLARPVSTLRFGLARLEGEPAPLPPAAAEGDLVGEVLPLLLRLLLTSPSLLLLSAL